MPTESNEKWQHLSRLLDQVLDLDAQERAEWLESLAKSDPEMAEMEMPKHIADYLEWHASTKQADCSRVPQHVWTALAWQYNANMGQAPRDDAVQARRITQPLDGA